MYNEYNNNSSGSGSDDRRYGGYYNGNGSYRNNGENETGGSEYRLTRGQIPRPDYRDASFVRESDAPVVPPRYYYTEDGANSRSGKKSGKTGRGMRASGVAALCLACAIIGGGMGGVVGSLDLFGAKQEETAMESREPSINTAGTPTKSPVKASEIVAGETLSGAEIYSLACPQTVGVTTEVTTSNVFGQATKSAVSGSGVIIRSDGYIVTNYHVIETALQQSLDITVMLYSGETYNASIVGYEKQNDIAVLKIDAEGLSAATLGDSNGILVGESVFAIGNPLGELTYTMTTGSLSALDRDITIEETNGSTNTINMFQFDAAVNSGNSGGPLYNSRGEVIGIVTAKYGSSGVEGLGFAIPINDAKSIAEELIDNGYVSGKAYLGISVNTVTSSIAQYYNMAEGAYILSMDAGGCAERAGLEVGDIITKLGDVEITSNSDLINAKKSYKAGDSAEIVVFRSGEYLTFQITFDEEIPRSDTETESNQQQQNQQTIPEYNQEINPYSDFFPFR